MRKINRSCVQLNDLPDELLIFIFKQMNNVEVLYSLFNVNERLDSILQDSIFTNYSSEMIAFYSLDFSN
jgi:hypothetical protein